MKYILNSTLYAIKECHVELELEREDAYYVIMINSSYI